MNSDAIITSTKTHSILCCSEIDAESLQHLLADYGLEVCLVDNNSDIPGSYWQEPEAGLIQIDSTCALIHQYIPLCMRPVIISACLSNVATSAH